MSFFYKLIKWKLLTPREKILIYKKESARYWHFQKFLKWDHPTIGGYPKIANVITADYDKLVQKTPGTIIKFKLVNLAVAENAFQDYVRKF